MPDYSSSGVWDIKNGEELDPVNDLKLPDELVKRLDKWIEVYDEATFNGKEPWEGGADIDSVKLDAVNCEGMYIAQEIKSLHPDWTVETWLEMHSEGKLTGMIKMRIVEVFKYRTV